jgi:hypothetical protein
VVGSDRKIVSVIDQRSPIATLPAGLWNGLAGSGRLEAPMKTVLTFGLALFALAGWPWLIRGRTKTAGKRGGYGGYERHGG